MRRRNFGISDADVTETPRRNVTFAPSLFSSSPSVEILGSSSSVSQSVSFASTPYPRSSSSTVGHVATPFVHSQSYTPDSPLLPELNSNNARTPVVTRHDEYLGNSKFSQIESRTPRIDGDFHRSTNRTSQEAVVARSEMKQSRRIDGTTPFGSPKLEFVRTSTGAITAVSKPDAFAILRNPELKRERGLCGRLCQLLFGY
jgi:hypothetical protein